jgi:hypothetical protein
VPAAQPFYPEKRKSSRVRKPFSRRAKSAALFCGRITGAGEMFDPLLAFGNTSGTLRGSDMISPGATRLFEHSLRAARWKRFVGRLHGELRRLERLECFQALARRSARKSDAVRAVALDDIHGSVDGGSAFDSEFYPVTERIRGRWVRVATALMRGEPLPPVELIQVGERYFVIDGHHRISAARMLHFTHIDAVVMIWDAVGDGASSRCISSG